VACWAEGNASTTEIDEGMKLGCNHPIGPLALADLIGLDVVLAVMQTIHDKFADSKYRPCPLLRELVAAGYLGRKTGRSVYRYRVCCKLTCIKAGAQARGENGLTTIKVQGRRCDRSPCAPGAKITTPKQ
jgi:3-hydroxyacyl-CoA dehydrogenase